MARVGGWDNMELRFVVQISIVVGPRGCGWFSFGFVVLLVSTFFCMFCGSESGFGVCVCVCVCV